MAKRKKTKGYRLKPKIDQHYPPPPTQKINQTNKQQKTWVNSAVPEG